jgi:hypothetical protein
MGVSRKGIIKMSRRSRRPDLRRLLVSLVAAIGLMLALFSPTVANASPANVDQSHRESHFTVKKPNPALTARWWQEFVAVPGPDALDRCDIGTRKIVFLAGTTGGTDTRTCTTKATTFLVPLINVECSQAEKEGNTFRELRTCARGFAKDFTDLTLVVDGKPVSHLKRLRVKAKGTFTPVEGNIFQVPPFTNSKFAADGYWALIKLTPGKHTLTFGGSYPPGKFTTLVTYDLIIKKSDCGSRHR